MLSFPSLISYSGLAEYFHSSACFLKENLSRLAQHTIEETSKVCSSIEQSCNQIQQAELATARLRSANSADICNSLPCWWSFYRPSSLAVAQLMLDTIPSNAAIACTFPSCWPTLSTLKMSCDDFNLSSIWCSQLTQPTRGGDTMIGSKLQDFHVIFLN